MDAEVEPSSPTAISHEYKGFVKIKGWMKKAVACLWDDKRIFNTEAKPEDLAALSSTKPLTNMEVLLQLVKNKIRTVSLVEREPGQKEETDDHVVSSSSTAAEGPENTVQGFAEEQNLEDTVQGSEALTLGGLYPRQQFLKPDGKLASSLRELDDAYVEDVDARGILSADSHYMEQAVTPSHALRDPDTDKQIGVWAPDVSGSEKRTLVDCLIITGCRGYLWCLGLVPTGNKEGEYQRVGLAYFDYDGWKQSGEGEEVVVEII